MKRLFLLAFLALVASTAFAQYAEAPSGDVEGPSAGGYEKWAAEVPTMGTSEQCDHEHMKLDSCNDYLMERCRPKGMLISWPWEWMKSKCEEVRKQCCQQLKQMVSQCRCKAIFRTIQGELGGFSGTQEGQKARVVLRAKHLPSKCNMSPRSCNIPITSGYYW
ncbi:puroindoline-B-like [Lolium rigidum]|uniref:puroindoline-B-like n=1 Tax=Lolium rigidum TaxID=89674 RepID=UPI001F5CF38E|nr:puroindoline-B-like [Lolium rigidum]